VPGFWSVNGVMETVWTDMMNGVVDGKREGKELHRLRRGCRHVLIIPLSHF
jgi:hypothetical protein